MSKFKSLVLSVYDLWKKMHCNCQTINSLVTLVWVNIGLSQLCSVTNTSQKIWEVKISKKSTFCFMKKWLSYIFYIYGWLIKESQLGWKFIVKFKEIDFSSLSNDFLNFFWSHWIQLWLLKSGKQVFWKFWTQTYNVFQVWIFQKRCLINFCAIFLKTVTFFHECWIIANLAWLTLDML